MERNEKGNVQVGEIEVRVYEPLGKGDEAVISNYTDWILKHSPRVRNAVALALEADIPVLPEAIIPARSSVKRLPDDAGDHFV